VNRIDALFSTLRAKNQRGFIAYLSAGDPHLEATRQLVLALDKVGVDLIELGVPFSDPLADGAVNQAAAQRALESGTTMHGVFETIAAIRRESEIPIVLYTYLNPLYAYGIGKFEKDAATAGVDGVLILDLTPEEDAAEFTGTGLLKRIRLIAPTTPPDRIALIAKRAEGFIYYVSREGVTGEQTAVATSIVERVALIRAASDLPIAIGFGVSTPEQAREVAASGDAVVVGSAIVRRIAEHGKETDLADRVAAFVAPLVAAVKN